MVQLSVKGAALLRRLVRYWKHSYDKTKRLSDKPHPQSGNRRLSSRLSSIKPKMPANNNKRNMPMPATVAPSDGCSKPKRLDRKEAVEVMCRICGRVSRDRTQQEQEQPKESCVIALDEHHVKLIAPSTSAQYVQASKSNESNSVYKLTHVFNEDDGQKAVFDGAALDLIENLIRGKNSLLFAYGVSGSGKTYTMTGSTTEETMGILPRTLDVLFNSLVNLADKCVFCSNHKNGFAILTDREASLARRMTASARSSSSSSSVEFLNRYEDSRRVSGASVEMIYAVFVSYIEIYNDVCYDLLSDPIIRNDGIRVLQSKELRLGANNAVYVDGAIEVEVQTSAEALEQFFRGQERRRVADTMLNKSSSRSHSVFNIRLVAAPCQPGLIYPQSDPKKIHVSQLSLVDLAGSERTKRTGNAGVRLAETGKINQSLLVLRQCFEKLRANQNAAAAPLQLPYRDSKLTYLFKNFFEGSGKIRMIICLNPRPDDYSENVGVLSFAELSQDVLLPIKDHPPLHSDQQMHSFNRHRFLQWMSELESSQSDDNSWQSCESQTPSFEFESSGDIECVQRLRAYFMAAEQQRKEKLKLFEQIDRSFEVNLRKALYSYDTTTHQLETTKSELEEANRMIVSLNSRLRQIRDENLKLKEQMHQCNMELANEKEQNRLKELNYAKQLQSRQETIASIHRIVETPKHQYITARRKHISRQEKEQVQSIDSRTSSDGDASFSPESAVERSRVRGLKIGKSFRRRSKSEHMTGTWTRIRPTLPPHMQRAAMRAQKESSKPIPFNIDSDHEMPLTHETFIEIGN